MVDDDITSGIATHRLYSHPYSICSLMVRYTLALRGKAEASNPDIVLDLREVDIFHGAQLEEHFLLNVNPMGQVPVLVPLASQTAPIAESVDITMYVAETYPDLVPNEQVRVLLEELHTVNFFSLSFAGRPKTAKDGVLHLLARQDISDRYRKALEYKLTVILRDKISAAEQTEVSIMEERARNLLLKIEAFVSEPPSQWLFGRKPSALDGHLIPFIARLREVGRENLIPQALGRYGDWAMRGDEWTKLMNGRTTMHP